MQAPTPEPHETGLPRDGRRVVTFGCGTGNGHEDASHQVLAARIADYLGCTFAGRLEDDSASAGFYAVPRGTLFPGQSEALDRLGADAFFGGRVASELLSTKAVMHPFVDPARQPPDWPGAFAAAVADLTLRGYTAMSPEETRRAALDLLALGTPVRFKRVHATGGQGQAVAGAVAEIEPALAGLECAGTGGDLYCIEENLEAIETYSVGTAMIGASTISYFGRQDLTRDNGGADVYGGSSLVVHPCPLDALGPRLPAFERRIVDCALAFDRLAIALIPGLVASRRNYDVLAGRDAHGRERRAVIDQSWRAGGASGAEIAAFEAFRSNPGADRVRASTVERYGSGLVPPPGATIYFSGEDPTAGPMLKYALVEDLGH